MGKRHINQLESLKVARKLIPLETLPLLINSTKMKKVKIFLASSNELKPERQQFEIEIYRKCKSWFDKGIFLHLDIWEDLSTRLSLTGSQSEYNKFVKDADVFVFL